MDNILKKVEKFIDGIWTSCKFSELKNGDKFRMYEADGQLEEDINGRTEFVATSNPYSNKDGILTINCKD
jgi:hypothetical protein